MRSDFLYFLLLLLSFGFILKFLLSRFHWTRPVPYLGTLADPFVWNPPGDQYEGMSIVVIIKIQQLINESKSLDAKCSRTGSVKRFWDSLSVSLHIVPEHTSSDDKCPYHQDDQSHHDNDGHQNHDHQKTAVPGFGVAATPSIGKAVAPPTNSLR